MDLLSFIVGLMVGMLAANWSTIVYERSLLAKQSAKLPKIIFTTLGEAFWQSENGLCKAAVLANGIPDFNNAVVLNMMEVPAEELPMLLEIISRLK